MSFIGLGDFCNCADPSAAEMLDPLCVAYCGTQDAANLVSPPTMPATTPPMLSAPPAPQTQAGMTVFGVWTPETQAEVTAALQGATPAGGQASGGQGTAAGGTTTPSWCNWVPFSSYFSSQCPSGTGIPQVLLLILAGIVIFALVEGAIRK
jgi:hypothetical protein